MLFLTTSIVPKRDDISVVVIFEGTFVSSDFFDLLLLDFSVSFVSGFNGTTARVRAGLVALAGAMVATVVGAREGATVEVLVGAAVGAAVGVKVGARLRAAAGALVGALVGAVGGAVAATMIGARA
jgi:hypothetical protein